MQERLQGILNRIKEWWSKFTTKQKALLISIVTVVVMAIVVLAFIMTRPKMVTLINCESTKEAGTVKDLLEGESIAYEVSKDGLTFSVNEKDEATASILLGSNDIPTEGYSIDNVFDGGFSSTEADKTKKYQLYLEERFADHLSNLSNVESATVSLSMPADDGTIISKDEETYASVILTLDGEMDEDQAAGIAQYIATEVGNDTTDRITILDSDTNMLFSGGDSSSNAGKASSNLSYRTKVENQFKSNVKDVVMGTNVYDNVEDVYKRQQLIRAHGKYTFPADFMLVAAMNPCKCGYYPDMQKCTCTDYEIRRYRNRISQPLLDRMDLCVKVEKVHYQELEQTTQEESSESIRERVVMAHKRQRERYEKEEFFYNSQIPAKKIATFCALKKDEKRHMQQIYETLNLSVRSYHKILKTARTIADIEGSEEIRICLLYTSIFCE